MWMATWKKTDMSVKYNRMPMPYKQHRTLQYGIMVQYGTKGGYSMAQYNTVVDSKLQYSMAQYITAW